MPGESEAGMRLGALVTAGGIVSDKELKDGIQFCGKPP